MRNNKKLYNFKKFFLMVIAILIGSMFGGYQAYDKLNGSVTAGICVGGISFVAGTLIVFWVIYYGNKEVKD